MVTPRLRLHACDFLHFSKISWNRGLHGCYKGRGNNRKNVKMMRKIMKIEIAEFFEQKK